MESETIIGYKKLIPTGPSTWMSPIFQTEWTDNQLISPKGPGVHALFDPQDEQLCFYDGCLVTIQAEGKVTIGEKGFTCKKAVIIGYDECEIHAVLRFYGATLIQQVAIAIVCAMQVYKAPTFITWESRWLSGEDRTWAAATWAAAGARAARAAETKNPLLYATNAVLGHE